MGEWLGLYVTRPDQDTALRARENAGRQCRRLVRLLGGLRFLPGDHGHGGIRSAAPVGQHGGSGRLVGRWVRVDGAGPTIAAVQAATDRAPSGTALRPLRVPRRWRRLATAATAGTQGGQVV